MNTFVKALAIVSVAASLGACSGMSTQDRNTAIGAGVGESVADEGAVSGGLEAAEGGGAVGAEGVGIEEDAAGGVRGVGDVQDVLVLETVVAEEEVARAGA